MIKAESISYAYTKGQNVFDNLSFSIEAGEFWGILGRNGAGKSTLVELMLDLKKPSSGELLVASNSEFVAGESEIAFLSQDITIKYDISIKEFLKFHSSFFSNYSHAVEEDLLKYFELDSLSIIAGLSTGQKKLVMVIACLSSMTKILLIDEITAVLDPVARHKFFEKLLEFNKKYNLTIILATNISEDLVGRVDKILYIEDNKSEVIEPSQISEIFKL